MIGEPVAFIASTDLARARHFYEGTLELTIESDDGFALIARVGPITVRITNVGPELRPQAFTVFGWEVADVSEAVRSLHARGVSFLQIEGIDQDEDRIWTAPGGAMVAWFKDPDGNTLSISG